MAAVWLSQGVFTRFITVRPRQLLTAGPPHDKTDADSPLCARCSIAVISSIFAHASGSLSAGAYSAPFVTLVPEYSEASVDVPTY
jgi:hypothetical protein